MIMLIESNYRVFPADGSPYECGHVERRVGFFVRSRLVEDVPESQRLIPCTRHYSLSIRRHGLLGRGGREGAVGQLQDLNTTQCHI